MLFLKATVGADETGIQGASSAKIEKSFAISLIDDSLY
jgi:hypothetical protein